MGVPLTTVLFLGIDLIDESKIQIPMVIFQGFQIFQGSLLTIVFRRWIEAEEELKSIEKPSAEVEAEVGSAQAEKAYHNKPRAADNS
jgi:sodium/bile acid cotransporter 7